ncbi:hypothetical protein RHGRI_001783 [Rhododendron griersonianum]|uniref:Uncharacterized protein n=1 Tax=Rhododendron griersonianum TaxID=479676 RepID=A0AAV6LMN7_9ERIC|nr:hypothetical protein RHGRI_001783 [Rhododendron griersonianum]
MNVARLGTSTSGDPRWRTAKNGSGNVDERRSRIENCQRTAAAIKKNDDHSQIHWKPPPTLSLSSLSIEIATVIKISRGGKEVQRASTST